MRNILDRMFYPLQLSFMITTAETNLHIIYWRAILLNVSDRKNVTLDPINAFCEEEANRNIINRSGIKLQLKITITTSTLKKTNYSVVFFHLAGEQVCALLVLLN